jgi:hypothetical protein
VWLSARGQVADKNIPALSYLSPAIAESFKAPIIKFQQVRLCARVCARGRARSAESCPSQADLSRADHVQKVFGEEPGFNYVFNLCGETRFGLTEADYKKKTLETAVACGKAAAANKVQKVCGLLRSRWRLGGRALIGARLRSLWRCRAARSTAAARTRTTRTPRSTRGPCRQPTATRVSARRGGGGGGGGGEAGARSV